VVLLFCLIGAYSINNNVFDIGVMIIFGILGYLFKKFGYQSAPLILCFVLGPMFEVNLRRSLLISQGSFSIFFTRPIALAAIVVCALLLLFNVYQSFAGKNRPVMESD
jgi:putative tricarboxylic transport membrane protein